ncbi:MAG TPA: NUDIX hydrolase [Vicinamibacterales bacterium]|jgi:ADP-ribose pyrophosphatase
MNRSVVFASPWCRLLAEPQASGDPYYMLDVPDYVGVVARTRDGRIMLVRQHRPAIGRDVIELPSGHVNPGEVPEQAARRELLEETGMVAHDVELLGVLAPDVGRLTNRMWCYFAPDVTPHPGAVEIEEGITVLDVSERELLQMATDGRLDHALNLAVLFLAISKQRLNAA